MAALLAIASPVRGDEDRSLVLFYRMLGAATNRPLLPHTRTACCIHQEVKTGSTVPADRVLTIVGLRGHLNDVAAISGRSAAVRRTASGG